MSKMWFGAHVAYTMAKYGMSMCVLGMAEEFKDNGIGVNALWPRTAIYTSAMEMLSGADSAFAYSRSVDIMADAAYTILCSDPRLNSGNFYIDDEVVQKAGIKDLKEYACVKENADKLMPDFFLDIDPATLKVWQDKVDGGSKSSSPSGDLAKVSGLFSKIESQLSEELVQKVNASYAFLLKAGDQESTWFIDLKSGKGRCGQGDGGLKADSTLTMKSDDFFDMFAGKLNAASAFMTGKLKISGDLQKAMKLEKLMGSLKSKL